MKSHKLKIASSLLIVLLSGCAEEVVVKRMKPAPAEPTKIEPAEDITDALAEFTPPYPEQIVLFEPDTKKHAKAGNRKKPVAETPGAIGQAEPDVELMGFGSVDGRFAILMIDGQLEALRVGERFGSVSVLEIKPPKVKLKVAGRVSEKTLSSEEGGM